jgi:hypothetical protein
MTDVGCRLILEIKPPDDQISSKASQPRVNH